jgi:hypothetical protein
MKKATPLLILGGVWATAFVSAGALAYALNRPLVPVATLEEVLGAPPPPALTEAAAPPPAATPTPIIRLAPVLIVSHVAATSHPRGLSEMNCSNWKGLTQGPEGQQVRYCE